MGFTSFNSAAQPDVSQTAAVTNVQMRLRKRWSRFLGVSWLQADIEFFGFLWTHHSHVGNMWSTQPIWRILDWWGGTSPPAPSWPARVLWSWLAHFEVRPGYSSLARFSPVCAVFAISTIQENTAIFGHTRPAGLDAILLQISAMKSRTPSCRAIPRWSHGMV